MNKKENPGVSRRGAAMLLLFSLAVSVLLGFAMPVHAADDGRTTLRTLRVGFYPYTGYMATAADGSRSGYAYELLQDIAQHENVTFAYSCLDGNTQQAMQQLAAGQIDLIPVLRRTAERDEQFAFSAEPIGTVATMLTVKAGNRSIVAGDYDTFDGITVGMSRSGNGRNESFQAYAEEHGFRYTPVYYDTDEELSSALRNGEITAAASNRLRETKNEWIIDTFDEQSIYIAMRKDDTVTQQLVNDAISKINRNDPSWRTTLFNKYYTGRHTSSKIYLTDAEVRLCHRLQRRRHGVHGACQPGPLPLLLHDAGRHAHRHHGGYFPKGSRPGAAALQIPEARGPQRVQGHAGGRAGGFCH